MQATLSSIAAARFIRSDRRTETVHDHGCRAFAISLEGGLQLADLFLPPGASMRINEWLGLRHNLLMPVAGSALAHSSDTGELVLDPGTLYQIPAFTDTSFTLTNPYPDQTVNLLYIGLPVQQEVDAMQDIRTAPLTLTAMNRLTAGAGFAAPIRIGIYDSRIKDIAAPVTATVNRFCYVLNGAFEVEGRLMEYRDGLCLPPQQDMELEALSEAAIILLIDF